MNKFTQLFATPSQIEATAATTHEMKIVPRRANNRFKGSVSQQPISAHARYGGTDNKSLNVLGSNVELLGIVSDDQYTLARE